MLPPIQTIRESGFFSLKPLPQARISTQRRSATDIIGTQARKLVSNGCFAKRKFLRGCCSTELISVWYMPREGNHRDISPFLSRLCAKLLDDQLWLPCTCCFLRTGSLLFRPHSVCQQSFGRAANTKTKSRRLWPNRFWRH